MKKSTEVTMGLLVSAFVLACIVACIMAVDQIFVRPAPRPLTLSSTNMSPAALQAMLFNLPIPELKKPEAQLIMSPILASYKAFFDQTVKGKVDANPGLRTLITAMIDGLDQGLVGIANLKPKPAPTARITDEQSLEIIMKALDNRIQESIQSGG